MNYWWLCADPNVWSFSRLKVGESKDFAIYSRNGGKNVRRANFFNARVGDLVIGYEATPIMQVTCLLRVSKIDFSDVYFEKVEEVNVPLSYDVLKRQPELANMSYIRCHSGTLFPLKEEEYAFIIGYLGRLRALLYSPARFLSEVFMEPKQYESMVTVLRHKKNIILQGAPGVGKTYAARRLAYADMGWRDESHIEFVQFHQNYSYEDFVEGYRPHADGFTLQKGVFRRFCERAAEKPDLPYYFIIDEINRGNMSKIFGELLMLIEKDYRGTQLRLPYSGELFTVPPNLCLIGMMNTADRSLAMIDYALRRRFSFVDMEPAFESDSFKGYQQQLACPELDHLIGQIKALNKDIAADKSLGKGFCIGHSYFCGLEQERALPARLKAIVEYDILPMLREYWFDEPQKVESWEQRLALP